MDYENLTPQYRIEEYLEAIVKGYAEATQYPYPDYPSWRIEEFLDAFITYIWEDESHPRHPCPEPAWRLEECLRAIYDVMTGAATPWPFPTPTNRIEEYLAAIHAYLADGTELPVPEPVWRIEQWLAYVLDGVKQGGGSGEKTTVTGTLPLTLANALSHAIVSLTRYGLCTQGGTPTPDAPVDIMCNNGALKMLNLANMAESNLDIGYYLNNSGSRQSSASNFYTLGFIPVKPGTAYTVKTSESINLFNITEYDSAQGFLKRTLWGKPAGVQTTFTTRSDTAYLRFGSNMNGNTLTYADIAAVTWMLTEGETAQDYVPYGQLSVVGTPEVLTVSGPNLLNPATNITGKYITAGGNIKDGADAQYTDLIPVTAGETYVWSLVSNRPNGGNNRCHGYDSAGNWVQQIAFDSTGIGIGLPFLLIATIPNGISYVRLSYGINDTEVMFKKQNYDQLINTFYEAGATSDGPIIKNSSSPVQSPYNGSWKVGVFFEAIPGAGYAFSHDVFANGTYVSGTRLHVGFYEKAEDVTDESKCLSHLKGVQQFTVPNEAHYVVIEFDGTKPFTFSFVGVAKVDDYQPYVTPQTASVPMLLSVGDVKDEVELIHGPLTRRVAACLYDGTQPVGDVYMSTTGGKDAGAIIVYPLATPTTEQTTAQNLVTNEGTNIVDSVANVSPLTAEVKYMKGGNEA